MSLKRKALWLGLGLSLAPLAGAYELFHLERFKLEADAKVMAGFRHGDTADMAIIELVDRDPAAKGLDSGPTGVETVEAEAVPANA